MQTSALLLLLTAALAADATSAEPCVFAALAPTFLDLLEPVYACADATGYNIVPPSAKPTPTQNAAICAKCTQLLSTAAQKTFPSCTLKLDGVDARLDEYFADILNACGDLPLHAAVASSTSTSNSSTSANTSMTVGTVTTPTTESGVNSSSSSNSRMTTPTTANTSVVATPMPSSSSSRAVATTAVTSAVAVLTAVVLAV